MPITESEDEIVQQKLYFAAGSHIFLKRRQIKRTTRIFLPFHWCKHRCFIWDVEMWKKLFWVVTSLKSLFVLSWPFHITLLNFPTDCYHYYLKLQWKRNAFLERVLTVNPCKNVLQLHLNNSLDLFHCDALCFSLRLQFKEEIYS